MILRELLALREAAPSNLLATAVKLLNDETGPQFEYEEGDDKVYSDFSYMGVDGCIELTMHGNKLIVKVERFEQEVDNFDDDDDEDYGDDNPNLLDAREDVTEYTEAEIMEPDWASHVIEAAQNTLYA